MDLFIQAPNHLGDGVMALPAVTALCRRARRTWVAAPEWGQVVYRGTGAKCLPRAAVVPAAQVAVLLGPSFRAAWRVRRIPRRIGLRADGRSWLLTDGLEPGDGHRAEDYARLAAVLGAEVEEPPRFQALAEEQERYAGLPWYWGFNPLSVSGAVVEWRGYTGLLAHLPGEVRLFAGPGETSAVDARFGPDGPVGVQRCLGLGLEVLAGMLQRCRALVSNDSGVAHFAAACGVPVVVIHGSTNARRTGTAGASAVEGPALPCRPCYRKRCALPPGVMGGPPCLDVGVAEVAAAMRRADRAPQQAHGTVAT